MKRVSIVMLALFVCLGTTFALAVDPGTGLQTTYGKQTDSPQGGAPRTTMTIGYTTDALIAHYQTMDGGNISSGRADIIAQGHTLVPINSLNPGDLDNVQALIIGVVTSSAALSAAQMDVVEDFVMAGGNLYFLGENNNHFRENNVAVGGRFGIEYPPVNGDPPETVLTLVATHPIMQGPYGDVTTVDGSNNSAGYYGSMSSPGPYGSSILDFPGGHSACVVIECDDLGPDSGLVVALAEINTFDNGQIDAGDNRVFWNNIFAYVCGPTATEEASWSELKSMWR